MPSSLFNVLRDALIDAAIDVAGPLVDSQVGLFLNSPDLANDALVLADFTQPTFAGYALDVPASWIAGVGDNGDPLAKPVTPITFTSTDDAGFPSDVMGWFIAADTSNAIQAAGYFDSPIRLSIAGQSITFSPVVPLDREMEETGDGFTI